ncbi:MAG: hypothetical protein HKO07_06400 [Pseudomonadales bacterium]|nr:hypothetical protein [Pseudomonadales bacterium]
MDKTRKDPQEYDRGAGSEAGKVGAAMVFWQIIAQRWTILYIETTNVL